MTMSWNLVYLPLVACCNIRIVLIIACGRELTRGVMAKKTNPKHTGASGVNEYIANAPKQVQDKLKEIRAAIRKAAPGATERTDYFQMPGYSYDGEGYDYNGMFVWFSFRKSYVRLHLRPPVIQDHKAELSGCLTTKAIVSFPSDKRTSMALVGKLVKASLKVMKDTSKLLNGPLVGEKTRITRIEVEQHSCHDDHGI
jgi:uncharacterized protein YdhG (YjbR/CyaY superfamily)